MVTKEKEDETLKQSRMTLYRRLIAMNMPELPFILVGLLGSVLFGIASPLFSAAFGDMLIVLSEKDIEKARYDSKISALELAGVGLGFLVTTAIQVKKICFI